MIDDARLERALQKARKHLLAARRPEGFWEGRLSSSALSTATAITALMIAAQPEDAGLIARGCVWLAQTQNPDGGWGDTPDSPSNLSTSLLAFAALTIAPDGPRTTPTLQAAERYVNALAGDTPDRRAAAVQATYGADRTFAVPILANCALAGLVSWKDIPGLPFELAVLPQELYRAVRMQVVSYALPALIAVGLLLDDRNPSRSPVTRAIRRAVTAPLRRKLAQIQPEHGGFLEATPLTAFVAMSLVSTFGPHDSVARKCLAFLRHSARDDGSWPIDTHLSMWVTTSAINALAADGGRTSHGVPDARVTRRWIAAAQHRRAHPFTGARPGGWAWTPLPGGVPDADDTAGAILALAGTEHDEGVAGGARWLLQLQNADGGWPTFCRGWGRLPFDRSCPDITAHALRALHAANRAAALPGVARATTRGLRYLAREQRPDGSWIPLWFGNQATQNRENPVLGAARVLTALSQLDPLGDATARALQYLADAQNEDGGWGGAAGIPSSVEETALAVVALTRWPQRMERARARGVTYLVARIEDGTWTHPAPIGLYFAALWYSEDLYPVIWTVEALACARGDSSRTPRAP